MLEIGNKVEGKTDTGLVDGEIYIGGMIGFDDGAVGPSEGALVGSVGDTVDGDIDTEGVADTGLVEGEMYTGGMIG